MPVVGDTMERPTTDFFPQLDARLDDLIGGVPDFPANIDSELWRTYCMVCAPLAWDVKLKNQPIQQLFQHLVNDAIDLGLGTEDHFAVDRGLLIMKKLGFDGIQLKEVITLLNQSAIHFRRRPTET